MRFRATVGAVAVMGIVLSVPSLWAQDLGDVARRDRERRARLAIHGPVLTNEDLQRERILTPELRSRILTQLDLEVSAAPDVMSITALSIPLAPPDDGIVPPPIAHSMVQQIARASRQAFEIEVLQPAAIAAQQLPGRSPEYSEPAVVLNAANNEPVSLGENVRQLRVHPAESIVVRAPEATTAEINNPVSHEEISLGEYARQLASRHMAEPLVASEPAVVETAVDAGQPVSLADYTRQLRTMRTLSASESATITPLPPVEKAKARQPEISLGEYARQLRIRRAAEEYARLLAQDETPAILTAKLSVPIRYHEIRPTPPPSLRRAAPVANSDPAQQGQVAVTVRRGDSLWRLARTFLGAGARWRSLSFLKGHRGSPELIREGEVVLIPVSEAQRERALAIVADRRSGRPLR